MFLQTNNIRRIKVINIKCESEVFSKHISIKSSALSVLTLFELRISVSLKPLNALLKDRDDLELKPTPNQ